jgi:hypothetical protein
MTEHLARALRESLHLEDASVEHLTADEITAYVDATVDEVDREIIETHLEICATCAEDVQDLRNVQAPMRSRKRAWYALAGLAAAAALAAIIVWNGRNVQQPGPSSVATPAIVVSLKNGVGRVTLDTAGTLTGIPTLAAGDADLIVAALRSGRVDVPSSTSALRGRTETLLGAPSAAASFRQLRPLFTAIESQSPRFEWTALPAATSYAVSVFDANLDKIAQSGPLTATEWTPTQPLPRGRTYLWQVRARTPAGDVIAPAPPTPESRFRVLDPAEADRVVAWRERYAGSPLALGVLFAHAGLLEEAERYLKDVVAANPSSSPAQQLLASVQEPSPTTTKPAQ